MARTVNQEELEQKRTVIISEAIQLITDVGYKSFSVNQVIKRCGISKGSFFHHFENKDALIESMTDRLTASILTDYDSVLDNKETSAKEKIHLLFQIGYQVKMEGDFPMEAFVNILFLPENQELYQKLTQKGLDKFMPYIERIITNGCEIGEFEFAYPKGVARHFVQMMMGMNIKFGKVLYNQSATLEDWQQLHEELLAFEVITQMLFGFDEAHRLYGNAHKLVEMKLVTVSKDDD